MCEATSKGTKYDDAIDKTKWHLVPMDIITELADLYTRGAVKYGENDWKSLPDGVDRYYSAALRHIAMFARAKDAGYPEKAIDDETTAHHLIAAVWNLVACRWLLKHQSGNGLNKKKIAQQKIMSVDEAKAKAKELDLRDEAKAPIFIPDPTSTCIVYGEYGPRLTLRIEKLDDTSFGLSYSRHFKNKAWPIFLSLGIYNTFRMAEYAAEAWLHGLEQWPGMPEAWRSNPERIPVS